MSNRRYLECAPSPDFIRVLDTGAPRDERNHFYVQVNGVEVFTSTRKIQCDELAANLKRALWPGTN